MSKMTTHKKARWIAEQTGENQDDVLDVLLGNITAPYNFCNSVETLSREYDAVYSKVMRK